MLSSTNTVADVETLYARLGERDYEAVMSYLADDIVWIVADNSPLADHSPYNGIGEVRSGVFERLTAGFGQVVFVAGAMLSWNDRAEISVPCVLVVLLFAGASETQRERPPRLGACR